MEWYLNRKLCNKKSMCSTTLFHIIPIYNKYYSYLLSIKNVEAVRFLKIYINAYKKEKLLCVTMITFVIILINGKG